MQVFFKWVIYSTAILGASQSFANTCNSEQLKEMIAPATATDKSVHLTCSIQLPTNAKITKQLVFQSAQASNLSLDCQGAKIDTTITPAILIQSTKVGKHWSVPQNITIQNCQINGAVRIHGMGRNGESAEVKVSSIQRGHTERVQQAAPRQITLKANTFIAGKSNMLYLAPGVNDVTIKNNKFLGQAGSLAIYLDAESKANRIENNIFDVQTPTRELIAVDGSAHNTIVGNQFIHPKNGVVFFYRNCGEGGTVRHQTPSYNQVMNNTFKMNKNLKQPMIWLGSRNGNRNYCGLDEGYAFGSSQSDLDYAEFNQVVNNQIELKKAKWYQFWLAWKKVDPIAVDSLNNTIQNNHVIYK